MKGTGFWAVAVAANTVKTVRTAMNRTNALRARVLSLRLRVMGDLLTTGTVEVCSIVRTCVSRRFAGRKSLGNVWPSLLCGRQRVYARGDRFSVTVVTAVAG